MKFVREYKRQHAMKAVTLGNITAAEEKLVSYFMRYWLE